MNLATGALIFLGFLFIVLGIASKAMGCSLLSPFIQSTLGYFVGANTCILLALIVDKFDKR